MSTLTPEAAAAILARMEELERVAEKATPGPWSVGSFLGGSAEVLRRKPNGDRIGQVCQSHSTNATFDSWHIATFDPPTALSLLSLIRYQRERIEQLELELEDAEERP